MPYSAPERRTTMTSTGPGWCASGLTAVTAWSETTWNDRAGVDPKRTAITLASPRPLMVTLVPPSSGPVFGDTRVMPDGDVAAANLSLPAGPADPATDRGVAAGA